VVEEFGYPDYVVEILNELKELRREVAKLQQQVAELAKRQSESRVSDADVLASRLREELDKLNAAVAAVLENASWLRSAIAEGVYKREELCALLLEKILALQELLKRNL